MKKVYKKESKKILVVVILLIIVLLSTLISHYIRRDYGVPYKQGEEIVAAARIYISNEDLRYDGSYFEGGYPPEDIGVCTDVVWNALKPLHINLKEAVSNDIEEDFEAYKSVVKYPDPNIDFRRVDVLEIYMDRNCKALDEEVDNPVEWMPGDFVTFDSSHIAVISDITNIWGRPFLIQHGRDPAAEEDRIVTTDDKIITGHYRVNVKKW